MNPFNRPRLGAVAAVALASNAVAQETAQKITEERLIAWHGQCVAALRERLPAMEQVEASEIAMELFREYCGLTPYLDWEDATVVAGHYNPTE